MNLCKTDKFKGTYITKAKNNRQYRMILCPCHPNVNTKGYVFEHRLVMEVHLNRILTKDEIVHHKDGDGLNNNLENLDLITKTEHSKLHKYWLTSPREGNTWAKIIRPEIPCKHEGCTELSVLHGFCHNHSTGLEKLCIKCNISKDVSNFHNDKNTIDGYKKYCKDCRRVHDKTTCTSCGKSIFNKGLCKECSDANRRNSPRKICKVEGCGKVYHGLGYCSEHLSKFKRHGNPLITQRVRINRK